MDKLFKMLARGETPNFAEMMEALNSISDIDWEADEPIQQARERGQNKNRVPNYPVFGSGEFCESCG